MSNVAAQAPSQATVVAHAIQEISHIATLPEITLRIVELVESPTSTAQELHSVISHDPALCSRILKVVNSAFYGLPGQIASIDRAIVLLGLNAVKNIAVAASLVKLFRGGEMGPHFAARDLWVHSVGTASAAKIITDKLGLGFPDEAFLGGLIHDIGVMVELQFDRQKLLTVIEKLTPGPDGVPRADMLAVETEVFGANHQQFGEGLCRKWKFPVSLANITGNHHNPLDLPSEARTMACVVHVADRLAGEIKPGFRLDLTSTEISDNVLAELRLSRERLEDIRSNLPEMLAEVKRLLG